MKHDRELQALLGPWFDPNLAGSNLRQELEANCLSYAEISELALEETPQLVPDRIAHVDDCMRCSDLIGLERLMAEPLAVQPGFSIPRPVCRPDLIQSVRSGGYPITPFAERHLTECAPCRNALFQLLANESRTN